MTLVENGSVNANATIQSVLNDFSKWAVDNNMKLNPDKCVNMNVCFMRNPPQLPPLQICSKNLQVVDYVKILGVLLTADLKWDKHVAHIHRKASGKLFMVKLLKKFNLSVPDLLTIYRGYVRPLLEYAVPSWNAGLNSNHVIKLERIQRRALRIILGARYEDYDQALEECNLDSLHDRRVNICEKFANSLRESPTFNSWLPRQRKEEVQYRLRNGDQFKVPKCNTQRYKQSAIPYFISILNQK
jgi:hypothetical protein